MKKLILCTLAALGLAACSREAIVKDPAAAEANLTIRIEGTTKMSKVTKATTAEKSETYIASAKAFVFRGSDNNAILDCQPFDVNTDGSATNAKVTSAAEWVFMVSNADLSEATLAGIRTLSDLKALTADLFEGEALTQTPGELLMWGSNRIQKEVDSYKADVTLRFAPSKVVFTYTLSATNAADLTAREITVFNAQGASRLVPAATVTSATDEYQSLLPSTLSYYAGSDMSGFTIKPETSTVKATLKTANAQAGVSYTYYLFESEADTQTPTIIALSGTYAGQQLYYPIACSNSDSYAGTTFDALRSGKQYDITIGIRNLHAGSADPTAPVSSTDLVVTVTEAAWDTAVEWNKEFN